jgi:hypothetical protein
MAEPQTRSSINSLKTIIGKRGLAKVNRFEVDFSGLINIRDKDGPIATQEEARHLSTLVTSTTLPGRQLTTFGYNLFRHQTEFPTGYVNEALSMEIALTGDYFAKKIFDRWLNIVVPKKEYLMAYTRSYKCPIRIKQLSNQDKVIYQCLLDDCFPKAIRGVAYNSETDDISAMGVEFAYNDLNFSTDPGSITP